MNRDFVEMLSALCAAGAEFLVVGAHALAAHGAPRATGDLDIWIRATPENADRVLAALRQFGAPLVDLTKADLLAPDVVFQIGLVPSRIDLLTSITGVEFDRAWPKPHRGDHRRTDGASAWPRGVDREQGGDGAAERSAGCGLAAP
jgi:hypothetical protein